MNSHSARNWSSAIILVLGVAIFSSGCATVAKKDLDAFVATHPWLTTEERSQIEKGQIALGFTMDMVRETWGSPGKVLYDGSLSPIWVYWRQDALNPVQTAQMYQRQHQTSQAASQAISAGNYGGAFAAIFAASLANAATTTGGVTKLYFLDGVLIDREYVADVRLINIDVVSE